MRNILLTLSFIGKDFCGTQVQKNGISVSEVLQDALEKIFSRRDAVKCCSRLDSGVHAKKFTVSFKTDSKIKTEKLIVALNFHLPQSVSIISAKEVADGFHARYSSIAKEYKYYIYLRSARNPFYDDYSAHYGREVDIKPLEEAVSYFAGKHDFKAFCNKKTKTPNDTVRTVNYAKIEKKDDFLIFTVAANGFLYNMVRMMAGALIRICEGKLTAADIERALVFGELPIEKYTAPAKGLFLTEVFYEERECERLPK